MTNIVGEGILDWFKKNHMKVGQKELNTLATQAKNNFSQLMGRNGQTWKTVTWDTLFKYLTIQNQLGLSREQVMKMFKDPEVLNKGKQAAQLAGALTPATFASGVWGTKGQIIGSPIDNNTEKRSKALVSMFLELGASLYLNTKAQTDEMPDEETPAPETPAPETPAPETPAPETPAPETPAPEAPAPPAKTGDIVKDDRNTAIYNLELALSKLKG